MSGVVMTAVSQHDGIDLEVRDEDRQVVFALTATGSGVDIDPAPLTVRGVITCAAVTEH